jgi:HAD superfamily hydrolase (TIGR01450 family)
VHPLVDEHDVALLDLDGVVYIGPDAVPGAAEALAQAREQGMRLAFVTNNAARPPEAVADHLTELGIAARSSEVVTSAQAAARYLADRLPGGAAVLVVGTDGLYAALRERGLKPLENAQGQVDAVVQGYSPDMNWRLLAEGAIAINRGVPWVATNIDPTVPSPRGPLPGNGSLVAALRHATGVVPVVTGKPDPTMHRESLLRSHAERPIVVGDRLDTDIEGANAVGCPSLLVFSGVTTVADLLSAPPPLRPTYIAADLDGLLCRQPEPALENGVATCGDWEVEDIPGRLVLRRRGGTDPDLAAHASERFDADALDAIRALCTARWDLGATGAEATAEEGDATVAEADAAADFADPRPDKVQVVAGDDAAARMLDRLRLAD